jgi:hypothetical protein
MILLRRIVIAFLILFVFAVSWIWWNKPGSTDLAAYAPADSLIYLESKSLVDIGSALTGSEAWQKLGPHLHLQRSLPSSWFGRFIRLTGIGPIETVIATRAQIALVMLNLGASEEGKTLKVKPDAAIIVETHTWSWRVKPATEKLIGQFARTAYGAPSFSRLAADDAEFLIWTAPSGSRQIIATVEDSVVIIGNSEVAVRTCLAVLRGQRPSLQDAPELQRMRQRLRADQALAFGYVSTANAGKLVATAAPLLIGSGRGDIPIDRVLAESATKLLGTMGWSSFATKGGIEDRYLFTIKEPVNGRLASVFRPASVNDKVFERLLPDTHSITRYQFESPLQTWQGVESAMLSQLDALSAVVFRSLWKSALVIYGIDDPETFLKLVGPQMATVRLRPAAERSVLLAEVTDRGKVESLLQNNLGSNLSRQSIGSTEVLEARDKELGAAISDHFIMLGPPDDVRTCAMLLLKDDDHTQFNSFQPGLPSATIFTYTNDSDRVRVFMNALAQATSYSGPQSNADSLERVLTEIPYSLTETALGKDGIERRTQSSFGQFSTIASLLFPNSP